MFVSCIQKDMSQIMRNCFSPSVSTSENSVEDWIIKYQEDEKCLGPAIESKSSPCRGGVLTRNK